MTSLLPAVFSRWSAGAPLSDTEIEVLHTLTTGTSPRAEFDVKIRAGRTFARASHRASEAHIHALYMQGEGAIAGGHYRFAAGYLELALRLALAIVEERKELIALIASKVAWSYRAMGTLNSALDLQHGVVYLSSTIYPQAHTEVLRARGMLGQMLLDHGDLVEARQLQEETLARAGRAAGIDLMLRIGLTNDLAATLRRLGDIDGARALMDQVEQLGQDIHPSTESDWIEWSTIQANLAVMRAQLGDSAGALRMEQQILDRLRRVFGDRHPMTLRVQQNLVVTLGELGSTSQAEPAARAHYMAIRDRLGDAHPASAQSGSVLAQTLFKNGKEDEAARVAFRVLEQATEILRSGNDLLDVFATCLRVIAEVMAAPQANLDLLLVAV